MTAEAWVLRAISDDALVAELLLRIKHSDETFADQLKVPSPSPTPQMFLPAGWGKHKARTAAAKKEKSEATRFSPNTPLSWNGGGGDGCGTSASDLYDETSRGSDGKSIARSKGGALSVDTASVSAIDKRSRKKRAFSELADEVALQLKENTDLKKEIAVVQMALEEKKAEKESFLKRLKKTDNGSILQSTGDRKMERKFVLPDLNFPPPIEEEEDLCLDYNPIHSSIS